MTPSETFQDVTNEPTVTPRAPLNGPAHSWRFTVGRKGINRVTVYAREDSPGFWIEWWEGGKRVRKSTKAVVGRMVTERNDAVRIATALSQRIAVDGWRRLSDEMSEQVHAAERRKQVKGVAALAMEDLTAVKIPLEPMCGVYFLLDGDTVAYIGKSKDVFYRVTQHRRKPPVPFTSVAWYPVEPEYLNATEAALIRRFQPAANRYHRESDE